MKEEKLQLTPQEQKGLYEITMNNDMPRNWITWVKWTNFWKHNLPKLSQKKQKA